jgi:hypothetical protein
MTTTISCGVRPLAICTTVVLGAALLSSESVLAQEPQRDPYFQAIGAKSTSYMPRVITRNIREDRAGDGVCRYDGKTFTDFSRAVPQGR